MTEAVSRNERHRVLPSHHLLASVHVPFVILPHSHSPRRARFTRPTAVPSGETGPTGVNDRRE